MAKIVITIEDGDGNKFGIVSKPSAREMAQLQQAGEATMAQRCAMITLGILRKVLAQPRAKRIMVTGLGRNN